MSDKNVNSAGTVMCMVCLGVLALGGILFLLRRWYGFMAF